MPYTYPENYKAKPLAEQGETLKKLFPKLKINIPTAYFSGNNETDGVALIPHWTLIAKTYNKAAIESLALIKESRPFYNWLEGRLGPEYLRETERKKAMLKPYENKLMVLPVQTGKKYAGISVQEARTRFAGNEVGLGVYEVAIIALTHPERFEKWNELDIDCPGDEYSPGAGGRFVRAPLLYHRGDELGFDARGCGCAFGRYGSASGFVPQDLPSTLESSKLSILDLSGEEITLTLRGKEYKAILQ